MAAPDGLHRGGRVLRAGPAPADAAAVLVHGRGGSAADILTLGSAIGLAGIAWHAPQAAGGTWYPRSFLAPLEDNEPHLSSALAALDDLLAGLAADGLPPDRVALIGFSQGACLALEYAARHPRRYGALAGLTGGLLGPPGTPLDRPGSLAGTPVFLASGDPDPHVPWSRVEDTAAALSRMDAEVDLRRYPRRAHTIGPDEIERVRELLAPLAAP